MGRLSTLGRERGLIGIAALVIALATLAISTAPNVAVVAVCMAIIGSMASLMNVVLFTLRQRRTDPAWMGRALAVSTSLNSLGGPLGSAIGGPLVMGSVESAFLVSAVAGVVASLMAMLTLPAET